MGLFRKRDPICGMKEEKGRGMEKGGKWFCSQNCLTKFEEVIEKHEKKSGGSCCH